MRIAIISLPLHTNYGGVLQAYALRSYLVSQGHEVTVLDRKEKMPVPKGLRAPFIYAGRLLKRVMKGPSGPEVFRELRFRKELPVVAAKMQKFIDGEIAPRLVGWYDEIREGEYDAVIVGSDQVWRPLYFGKINDAFLEFASGWDVLRIAYAASFGTDALEYDYTALQECSELLSRFDSVSVREESAVKACAEWFDYDKAVHVLDPVMLLDAGVYGAIAESAAEHPAEGKVMTYILDRDTQKNHLVGFLAKAGGLEIYEMHSDSYDRSRSVEERVAPAVGEWIAAFRDAELVVTDSFHGCVMCILFHKPFVATGNAGRGNARLKSLLDMFGLDQYMVHGIDPEDDGSFFLQGPDWSGVDRILEEKRAFSTDFLKNSLK